MAIPAQRFQYLDRETSLPSKQFNSGLDSSILNTSMNSEPPTVESLQSLIDSAIQSANNEADKAADSFKIDDALAGITRTTKDLAGSLLNLNALTDSKLGEYLSDIIPDANASRGIKGMIQKCRTNGSGYGIPGRPYDASMNCGAGKFSLGSGGYGSSNSCNASSYSNLLNKLSGGAYNAEVNDFNKLLKALMSLAGMGYNMDMCGVFSSLSGGLPNDVLSKAGGGLLGIMGQAGKTNAILDIASASAGLTPLLHNPNAVETFLGNYTLPRNIKESMYSNMADRTTAGLELLDESWNKSQYDGGLSMCKAPGYSDDLNSTLSGSLTNKSYGLADLDTAPSSDNDFMFASYGMKDETVVYV